MKINFRKETWKSGDDLFISIPKPEFFFGSMMIGWLTDSIGKKTKTTIFDLGDTIAILIPQGLLKNNSLKPGSFFAGSIRFGEFKKTKKLPEDLVDALKTKGVTLEILTDSERRHALLFLAESANPSIRMSRIETIVETCADAKSLKRNG